MRAVVDTLRTGERFLLGLHASPDGDTLGASLGLAQALRTLGKVVDVVCPDPIPAGYRFLPGADEVLSWDRVTPPYDALVMLDCGGPDRVQAPVPLTSLARSIVNVDHHGTNPRYGDVVWVEPTAAAVGEMVVGIIDALGVALTAAMALPIYTALVTDTGGFRHATTRAHTHRLAARLLEVGVDPGGVSEALFEQLTLPTVKLLARGLESLTVDRELPVSWIVLTEADFSRTGTDPSLLDATGLISFARSLAGVQVGVLMRPQGRGNVRVGLRSKGAVDVAEVARGFGGGGHERAAGCTLAGEPGECQARLRTALAAALAREDSDRAQTP